MRSSTLASSSAVSISERSNQQIFLTAEPTIESPKRDTGIRSHVSEANGLESALLRQLNGGLNDFLCSRFHRGRRIETRFSPGIQRMRGF